METKLVKYEESDYAEVGEEVKWSSADGVNIGEVVKICRNLPTADAFVNCDYYTIEYISRRFTRAPFKSTAYLNSNMMKQLNIINLSKL